MKKLLAFVLAVGLAVSTNVTAFAEDAATTETNDSTQNTEIAVNGSYQAATPAGSSISVDVVWEDMSFTYTGESQGAWDPKTHQYGDTIPAHWAWSKATEGKTAPNITLTNHSDTGVKATFKFDGKVDGLNGTFANADGSALTDNALTLPTALETDPAEAPSAATAFSVDGSGIDSNQQLGSITVTVAKDGTTGGDEDESGATLVSGADTLTQAISEGKNSIKLTENLQLSADLDLAYYSGTIDLNDKKLNLSSYCATTSESSNVTINNGTIESASEGCALAVNDKASVTVNNCTIITTNADALGAVMMMGNATLNNCTINSSGKYGLHVVTGGHLTLSGKTTVTAESAAVVLSDSKYATITCLAGTYNFDPTAYVDTSKYTITNDGNSTWTVTESTTGEDTPEA